MAKVAEVQHGSVLGCYGLSGGVQQNTPDYDEVFNLFRLKVEAQKKEAKRRRKYQ